MDSIILFITHFSFWLRSFAAAHAFLVAGLTANCLTAPFMRQSFAFVIQNFKKSFLNVAMGKVEMLMDVDLSEQKCGRNSLRREAERT
jgi:uncharacterized membrane protein